MSSDNTPSIAGVRRRLFCKTQSERLDAVADIRRLKRAAALPLIRRALRHWDRRLVAACATLYVELFGPKATADIIKVVDSVPLNHLVAINLLVQCGTPEAVLKIWSRRSDSRSDVADSAWEGLEKLQSRKAAAAICKTVNSWDTDLEKYLTLLPRPLLLEVFQGLGPKRRARILNDTDAREYFRRRKVESNLYPRQDDSAWLQRVLIQGTRLNRVDVKFLDRLASRALKACLESLPKLTLQANLADKPTAAYLAARGISFAEPAQKPTKKTRAGKPKPDYLSDLAVALEIDRRHLAYLCSRWNDLDDDYQRSKVPKRRRGFREILAPNVRLKFVQRAINLRILAKAPLHSACHGFRKDHSIISNAAPHVGQQMVINIDLKGFFPSISAARVFGVYKLLGHSVAEARFLTRLSTHDERLPQGAPTSPMLANIVCRRLDSRLAGLAEKNGAKYTRYADDLTFSGPRGIVNTLPCIRQIIAEEGLTVSEEKVRLTGRGNRQEVTGLVVNESVHVPRAIRKRLRAAFHRLAKGEAITWDHEEITLANLRGYVAFVKSVQPELGGRLQKSLKKHLAERKRAKAPTVSTTAAPQALSLPSAIPATQIDATKSLILVFPRTASVMRDALRDRPPALSGLARAVVDGDANAAAEWFTAENTAVVGCRDIVETILLAIAEAISLCHEGEFFIPELLVVMRAAAKALEPLDEMRRKQDVRPVGRAIVGCVSDHDSNAAYRNSILSSQNVIERILKVGGFDTVNLGENVTAEQLSTATQKFQPQVVALVTHCPSKMECMRAVVAELRHASVPVKIVVGGAPVTVRYAETIGADAYADDCFGMFQAARHFACFTGSSFR